MTKQEFAIAPASNGPIWVFLAICALFLCVALLFGYFVYSSRNVRFELADGSLAIKGGLYGRTIPARLLLPEGARETNLKEDRDHQLKIRTNGAGLPGYAAGWFRLRNGEKALAFVTDPTRVVYIPTRDNYSVLLSVDRPGDFLYALHSPGNAGAIQ